jgi:peptide/nickel transport system ATP-binding protein
MSAAPQFVLSIDDLSVSFRSDGVWRPVVESLSFDVGPGETVAVVGESGSGKSVTALSVMRLLPGANSKVEGVIRLDASGTSRIPASFTSSACLPPSANSFESGRIRRWCPGICRR